MSLVTAEQLAAQLSFEPLDGAGEGGLGHMTALGRAMEIERLADRQKISDLGHFHGAWLLMSPRYRNDH
jgi:hypothetical protein